MNGKQVKVRNKSGNLKVRWEKLSACELLWRNTHVFPGALESIRGAEIWLGQVEIIGIDGRMMSDTYHVAADASRLEVVGCVARGES